MFSVIVTAHNSEKYISETLESLLNQTFNEWECLIIENGSTDSTIDIVQNYLSDLRFKLIKLINVSNKSAALNEGIIHAKHDWISILDSDDLWTKNKLELQSTFIKNHDIDVLGTQIQYVDANGNYLNNSPKLPTEQREIISCFFNHQNAIANSSSVYRKSLHKKFGYYNVELIGVEDYDWWKRCARLGAKFANLNDVCFFHRVHDNSNFNTQKKQQLFKNLIDQTEQVLKSLK